MFNNLMAMIIESSSAMSKIISSILLDQLGFHQVIAARNSGEAARLLKSGAKVDLIISSWESGEYSTEALLGEIKRLDDGEELPFVLLTKDTSETFLVHALKVGVTEYIPKPFKPEDLTKAINKVAKTSERRRAVRYRSRGGQKVLIKFGASAAYSGILQDISTGGMMVKTIQFRQSPVNIYDSADVTIYTESKSIEAKAEVRRMEPDLVALPEKTSIKVAFMFTSVDATNMQNLLGFIELLKPDIPDILGVE